MRLIRKIKTYIPDEIKLPYHFMRSFLAALINGFPAKKLIVVGITGTKGKTSSANFVWSVLHEGGYNTGLISSAVFRIGEKSQINRYHMTMPDPFIIQKKLKEMVSEGVTVVVMEMTSEGMKQYRHIGIPVDFAVFTNLTPEHLESHKGSFEVYKRAKLPLFRAFSKKPKVIGGETIDRTIIANADSEHASFYLNNPADEKITYGIESGEVQAKSVVSVTQTTFTVSGDLYRIVIPGRFNIYNALPAIIIGEKLKISTEDIQRGVESLSCIPGRMEEIHEGQDFKVFVDYAHEPASLRALLETGRSLIQKENKVILLTGGQGGGRDPRKRKPMAEVATELADYCIVTNEDPYDDDPQKIIDEIAADITETKKKTVDTDLFVCKERRGGITKALTLARKGDIVLIAGKGAEETMMTKDGAIEWNEREIVREILRNTINRVNI